MRKFALVAVLAVTAATPSFAAVLPEGRGGGWRRRPFCRQGSCCRGCGDRCAAGHHHAKVRREEAGAK